MEYFSDFFWICQVKKHPYGWYLDGFRLFPRSRLPATYKFFLPVSVTRSKYKTPRLKIFKRGVP